MYPAPPLVYLSLAVHTHHAPNGPTPTPPPPRHMPSDLVSMQRLRTLAVIATLGAGLAACDLGSTTPQVLTDPASVTYATETGVTSLSAMTRVSAQLYRQDLVVGTGRMISSSYGTGRDNAANRDTSSRDSIAVYYTGRLSTGFRFDFRARPSSPFETMLDTTRVIRGWVGGLDSMRVGGTRRLVIGPGIGYGFNRFTDNAGNTVIPPNSVLVFDVELVSATRQPFNP
jgi:FKBP-type peptidyl-prolyl cis-trans isomerase